MTTTTIFKTPASSPPKFPSTPFPTPTQTPQNSLSDGSNPLVNTLEAEAVAAETIAAEAIAAEADAAETIAGGAVAAEESL